MKTFLKLFCLIFAALLLLSSCARGSVIVPTTSPAYSATAPAGSTTPETTPDPTPTPDFVPSKVVNLMTGVKAGNPTFKEPDETFRTSQRAFAASLFSRVSADAENKGKNLLVSPLSVMLALAMTANGAGGQTLAAFEKTLGGEPLDDLNAYLHTYLSTLPTDGKAMLLFADSIWFRDDPNFIVKPGFLQANADYYGADAFADPFNDDTVMEINDWVKRNTHGMIDKIIDELSEDSMMHLINALYFEGRWDTAFGDKEVNYGDFTAYNGSTQSAEYLKRTVGRFLYDGELREDEEEHELDLSGTDATGFMMHYDGNRFAFAALLPADGTDVYDYAASLTGEKLTKILAGYCPYDVDVNMRMPTFEADFSTSLNDTLMSMGLTQAFDDGADFSGISETNDLYIDSVSHKTAIVVDRNGTKAAAVTDVGMNEAVSDSYVVIITLNRPFIYMIVDTQTMMPVFMGVTAEV